MKRWRDPFPQTPQEFHDRVEQTLGALEEENMRHIRYRKIIVIVAALLALLAVGAVAAVIGGNRLKQELSDAGAGDMARRVRDVRLADAGEGFAFAIDEIAWEGRDLYVSCTASAPDDGNTYLLGLMIPRINGDPVSFALDRYMNDATPVVLALGGGMRRPPAASCCPCSPTPAGCKAPRCGWR